MLLILFLISFWRLLEYGCGLNVQVGFKIVVAVVDEVTCILNIGVSHKVLLIPIHSAGPFHLIKACILS